MKIVLLESLAVSDEVLQKYTRDLEQKGHTFCAYSRCDRIRAVMMKQPFANARRMRIFSCWQTCR